jgi:hypothetical protein
MLRRNAYEHVYTDIPDAYDGMYKDSVRLQEKKQNQNVSSVLGTKVCVE